MHRIYIQAETPWGSPDYAMYQDMQDWCRETIGPEARDVNDLILYKLSGTPALKRKIKGKWLFQPAKGAPAGFSYMNAYLFRFVKSADAMHFKMRWTIDGVMLQAASS